tara:strand:+ start:1415 stop:2110 length:696 start_codon:yes stop_codon:yes gene_type:complete
MNKINFSIVIPVLNEEKNITGLTFKIKKFCKNYIYEIIYVDDNSLDNSSKILNKLELKNNNLKYYIRKNKKKDLSASIFLGIKKSKYSNIIVMDGDLQHDPKYLPKIIKLFKLYNPDFIVCSRNFKKRSGLSLLRYFSSIFLILIIKVLFGSKLSDPMSGFFMFKKKIFFKYKNQMHGKGFKFLFDIFYQKKVKFKFIEYKIRFMKRKKNVSKMNFLVLFHLFISIFKKIF